MSAKHDWIGHWSMNHDGWLGRLHVRDTKADCAAPAWCDMAVTYVDAKRKQHRGEIQRVTDDWQHMTFHLDFDGRKQHFDAYLFGQDTTKLAGTTVWEGQTFGFFAVKEEE